VVLRAHLVSSRSAPPKLNPDLPASHGHAACLRADTHRQGQAGMLYRQIHYLVEEGDWAQQGEEVRPLRRPRSEAHERRRI
jgi:hypothetical protein